MNLDTMRDACAATQKIVDGIRADQHALPTPCSEWDVRSLLNHLLGTLVLGEALLTGSAPSVSVAPGELPDADLAGEDPAKAYMAGVEGLLAAAGGDALTRTHATPFGEMPGEMLAGFTTVDILVHGWDLAKATGQDADLDSRLAGEVLGFARQTLTDDTRAPRIAPALSTGADATVTQQLVAFLGRRP